MTKICWKCGKPHADGDAFCMYCGASFATEDMKYQTDGRTVSDRDDKAYLSAPPPKYKKSHKGVIIAIVAVVAIAVVAVLLLGGNYSTADVKYDEGSVQSYVVEDNRWVEYNVWVYNKTDHIVDTKQIWFELKGKDTAYPAMYGMSIQISPGDFESVKYTFVLDKSVDIEGLRLNGYSETYKVAHV